MSLLHQSSSALQIDEPLQLYTFLWACALYVFKSTPKGASKEIQGLELLD
jgi:hypothetical protein